jgi:cytochrome P450
MVLGLLPAALRDPSAFPDPETFDIRRQYDRGIVFGSGPHYCLGAALARLEGEVALTALVQRYPEMRLLDEPTYGRHAFLRKMDRLPIALGPARRSVRIKAAPSV